MIVNLLQSTNLDVLIKAIRTCYDSREKSDSYLQYDPSFHREFFYLGEKDKALIERILNDGHGSTLEHIVFTFDIFGISRLVLQELVRHRIASYSVKSTRYTLKELKNEKPFIWANTIDQSEIERISKYINLTGKSEIDKAAGQALENLRYLLQFGDYTNDEVKYALPESYKVNLVMTINLRSLKNLLELRLSERAHPEIQELAKNIKNAIPLNYQFLL